MVTLGVKGKGGFYRLVTDDGKKTKQAINLVTGEYQNAVKVGLPSAKINVNNIKQLFESNDKGADYAWRVMSKTLAYAAMLIPQAASNITDIDEAMRLGYNWKFGPFELIDRLGVDWFVEKLEKESKFIPGCTSQCGGKRLLPAPAPAPAPSPAA